MAETLCQGPKQGGLRRGAPTTPAASFGGGGEVSRLGSDCATSGFIFKERREWREVRLSREHRMDGRRSKGTSGRPSPARGV